MIFLEMRIKFDLKKIIYIYRDFETRKNGTT